jgi:hypothetical protein
VHTTAIRHWVTGRICWAGFEAREMGALSRDVPCKAFEIGE